MGETSTFRRWLIIAISAGTALWAVAQLTAGIKINNDPWPVTGFPMFKNTRTVAFHTDLFVRTRSGQTRQLQPTDYNLPRMGAAFKHLFEPPTKGHPPVAMPGGERRLGKIIAIWNDAHPGDPAVAARVSVKVYSLSPNGKGLFATRDKRVQVYQPVSWP
jgi:hypothetical protein